MKNPPKISDAEMKASCLAANADEAVTKEVDEWQAFDDPELLPEWQNDEPTKV